MPTSDAPRRLGVVVAGRTDVGRVRSRNEDAYLIAALAEPEIATKGMTDTLTIRHAPACLIVADGVGGAASGELASLLALDTMLTELRRHYSQGAFRSLAATKQVISEMIAVANQTIYTHALDHPEHHGMATTVTLALTYEDVVLVAQIGDSRAYLIHAGTARQLTKDQSLVQYLIDAGEITEAEAAHSSRRNVILQALGSEPLVVPDLYAIRPESGDILLLCSDGLSNYLTAHDITNGALSDADMAAVCTTLIACANARGGSDNITVVAGRFEQFAAPLIPATAPTFADRIRRWLLALLRQIV